jgi:hypothetical protein
MIQSVHAPKFCPRVLPSLKTTRQADAQNKLEFAESAAHGRLGTRIPQCRNRPAPNRDSHNEHLLKSKLNVTTWTTNQGIAQLCKVLAPMLAIRFQVISLCPLVPGLEEQ